MRIPLVDLGAQHRRLAAEIDAAVAEVMAGGAFVKGPAVTAFEEQFAAYCGAGYAVGVANGTDALHLILQAHRIGPGDEVVTVPTTFVATAEAVMQVGAGVRFADVDPETWMFDPDRLAEAVGDATRAVVPVHLYGHVTDHDRVAAVAATRGLLVVEDAAQAHGARFRGRRVGSLGDAAAFSFYPGKNLGALGDGGAVVTSDAGVAERVRALADHGRDSKYRHAVVGWNSRLDSIQAAVLSVKLRHLDAANEERRRLAARYRSLLAGVEAVRFPSLVEGTEPVHHLLVVAVVDRDGLRSFLEARGIATGIHYPTPLHLQPALSGLGHGRGDFPVAERLCDAIVSLPLYPELGDAGVDEVAGAVSEFYGSPTGPT